MIFELRNTPYSLNFHVFASFLKGVSFSAATCINNSLSLKELEMQHLTTDSLGRKMRSMFVIKRFGPKASCYSE